MVKSYILVSPKIGMYGYNNSYFQPNIICGYPTCMFEILVSELFSEAKCLGGGVPN